MKILLYPFLFFKKDLKLHKIYYQGFSNIGNKYRRFGILFLNL